MTLKITRRRFLQLLVITPAVPILPPVFIEPRWRGEMAVEFMLSENSYLFTGPGVWSEGPEYEVDDEWEVVEAAEGEGPYDYPRAVYDKLTGAERKILQLRKEGGAVRYVGEWENEDLNAFGEKLNALDLPLYLSNEWRWMGDWFSS